MPEQVEYNESRYLFREYKICLKSIKGDFISDNRENRIRMYIRASKCTYVFFLKKQNIVKFHCEVEFL